MTSQHALRRHSAWSRVPLWLLVFLTFVGAGGLQAASTNWTRPISEFDEIAHIDYAYRLSQGAMPTWDDRYTQRTLGIGECLDARSQDPACMAASERIPEQRWPDGFSYQAQQLPLGYAFYAAAFAIAIPESAHHFTQIRILRLTNMVLWILFAVAWTLLIITLTRNRLPALAATLVVATNPLIFDSFSYVTNDAAAIVIGAIATLWLLTTLRRDRTISPALTAVMSILIGSAIALTKITALAVVVAVGVGVLITWKRWQVSPRRRWWWGAATMALAALVVQILHTVILEARSTLSSSAPFDVMLPKTPLNPIDSITIRLTDLGAMVLGSGARTDILRADAGMIAPSAMLFFFSLAVAAVFMVAISLPRRRFPRLRNLQPSGLGIGVLAAAVIVVIAMPAIWVTTGGYLTYVPIGRYLGPIVPIAALVTLAAFERFRALPLPFLIGGVAVSAFGTVVA